MMDSFEAFPGPGKVFSAGVWPGFVSVLQDVAWQGVLLPAEMGLEPTPPSSLASGLHPGMVLLCLSGPLGTGYTQQGAWAADRRVGGWQRRPARV